MKHDIDMSKTINLTFKLVILYSNMQLGAGTFLSSNKQNAGNIAPKKKGCIMNEERERERERD
jgi:hypothetical protein